MKTDKIILNARKTPLILPVFNLSLLAGIIFYLAIFLKDNMQFDVKMLQAVLAFESVIFPFCWLIVHAAAFINKVIIENHCISSRNPFFNKFGYESLDWNEIISIKIKNFFGYKYFYFQSIFGNGIWIPAEISDKSKFMEVVKSKTGNDNIFNHRRAKPKPIGL